MAWNVADASAQISVAGSERQLAVEGEPLGLCYLTVLGRSERAESGGTLVRRLETQVAADLVPPVRQPCRVETLGVHTVGVDQNAIVGDPGLAQLVAKRLRDRHDQVGGPQTAALDFLEQRLVLQTVSPVPGDPHLGAVELQDEGDAEPTPAGAYPRSKAEAEAAVLATLPAAAIVRTSLIYGLEEIDHGTRAKSGPSGSR